MNCLKKMAKTYRKDSFKITLRLFPPKFLMIKNQTKIINLIQISKIKHFSKFKLNENLKIYKNLIFLVFYLNF